MSYRINRYTVRNRWHWRVWRGTTLLAKGARSYPLTDAGVNAMERDLHRLFPQWVR